MESVAQTCACVMMVGLEHLASHKTSVRLGALIPWFAIPSHARAAARRAVMVRFVRLSCAHQQIAMVMELAIMEHVIVMMDGLESHVTLRCCVKESPQSAVDTDFVNSLPTPRSHPR